MIKMDWSLLQFTGIMFIGLSAIGFLLSMLVSYLKCSKTGFAISFLQGCIWGAVPAVVYWVANSVSWILGPFSRTMGSFGVPENYQNALGVGYLMMLSLWVMTTYMIHMTESQVCQPSVDEMAEFQAQLLKELKEKEDAKQANEEKPVQ